jgi:hypothetical protein
MKAFWKQQLRDSCWSLETFRMKPFADVEASLRNGTLWTTAPQPVPEKKGPEPIC